MRVLKYWRANHRWHTNSITAFLWLFFITFSYSVAGEYDDLEGSRESTDFTPAERALFTEATNWFKKYEIPLTLPIQPAVYWLDDDHLVFSTTVLPEWTAALEEQPRIIKLNFITGEMEDSGYRGNLSCLSYRGDMLVRINKNEGNPIPNRQEQYWVAGRWGESLRPITQEHNAIKSKILCRFHGYIHEAKHASSKEIKKESIRKIPLLEKHGNLILRLKIDGATITEQLYIEKPNGMMLALVDGPIGKLSFDYQPWDDRYFFQGTSRSRSVIIDPIGLAEIHPIPRLLKYWTADRSASIAATRTKAGIVWTLRTSRSWRKQGVFLEEGKSLFRVNAAHLSWEPAVSPNGCRLYMNASEGDPSRPDSKYRMIVLDLCDKEHK